MHRSYGDRVKIPNSRNSLRIHRALSIPNHEIRFEFSRSGGPGGQHVNKVSTRVDCVFDVVNSPSLSAEQRERILDVLAGRIGRDGLLRVSASGSRSQWKNREEAIEKFISLLQGALKVRLPRVPSRPTAGARERRHAAKKIRSETKRSRSFRGRIEE